MTGIIIKSVGDRYTVRNSDNVESYICRARGKFRLDGIFPLTGDRVKFRAVDSGECLISDILPRKNKLIRPPVANADRMIITVSLAPPVTEMLAIDTLCTVASYNGLNIIICITKNDIARGDELYNIYTDAGYDVVMTSTVTGEGIEDIRRKIANGITVFAGSSGVGKSSLLKALLPGVNVKTSGISDRIGRGKHTTRSVELFETGTGGFIIDTPGFSHVDLIQMEFYEKNSLITGFPEFYKYISCCRYDDCSHTTEEGCAVIEAREKGEINKQRHADYVTLYTALRSLKDWQIRDLREGKVNL